MKLSIVIVSYNTNEFLKKCLASLFKQTLGITFEVIVVDNASTDGSQEMIKREFPQIKLIINTENNGFAAGNNIGIIQAKGEFVLLLNPDTEILDGAIPKTVSFMEKNKKIGIAGCKLFFPNQSLQRSVFSFPSVWNIFCESTFLYCLFSKSKAFGKYYLSYFDYESQAQVDWVHGAYVMIHKQVINTIGLLDEQFYMYSEEVDYCLRAKNAGFEIWYTPEGEVVHFWSGVNAINRRVMLWTYASQMLYFQKHFHSIEKYLIIGFKYMGMVLRTIVYAVAGCILFRKQMFLKSYYTFYSFYRLIVTPWKYKHNYTGKITPWPRV